MKKKAKRKIPLKHALVGGVLLVSTIGGGYFVFKNSGVKVPAYTASRVIDGDTFETKEKQLIRLSSADAPELDKCWGSEAKKALETLVLEKPLYIKVQYRDSYYRLISVVYTPDGSVNEAMIRQGDAYYAKTGKDSGEELVEAATEAREKQRGIHSQACTQMVNTLNQKCSIKGNQRANEKIYYTPSCWYYDQVKVQLYGDDQWFCTENDAVKAGFRKPEDC